MDTRRDGPYFVFVGSTTDASGATTQISAAGLSYRKKLLRSNPDNWATIVDLIEDSESRGALVTLTGDDFYSLSSENYRLVSEDLLRALASKPHIVFVHDSIALGALNAVTEAHRDAESESVQTSSDGRKDRRNTPDVNGKDASGPARMPPLSVDKLDDFIDEYLGSPEEDEEDWWGEVNRLRFRTVDDETRTKVLARLDLFGVNVMPYRTNVERASLAQSFLHDADRSLILRVYVPTGRLYAGQADRLLSMFQDWIGPAAKVAIRRDGYKTSAGQVYEFFSEDPSTDLAKRFADFSDFLDLCVDDARSAEASLVSAGVSAVRAADLTAQFATEGRRLVVDLRQQRERRIMQLAHEFEVQYVEEPDVDWKALVERIVPAPGGALAALAAPHQTPPASYAALVSSPGGHAGVVVHQQIFNAAVGQVFQSVAGNVTVGPEARQLLELIREFGGTQQVDLESAVHELEDPDARRTARFNARQRLLGFLGKVVTQVPPLALSTMQKYVEERLLGK